MIYSKLLSIFFANKLVKAMYEKNARIYVLSVDDQFLDDKELSRLYNAYIDAKIALSHYVRFAQFDIKPVERAIETKETAN